MKKYAFVLAATLAGCVAISAASLVAAAPADELIDSGRPIQIQPEPNIQPPQSEPEADNRSIVVEPEPNRPIRVEPEPNTIGLNRGTR